MYINTSCWLFCETKQPTRIRLDRTIDANGRAEVKRIAVQSGKEIKMPDAFRSYNSPEEAVDDYVNFLKKNKRYEKAGVFATKTSGEYFTALQRAGYATDPEYAKKLTSATEGTKKKIASLNMVPSSSGMQLASASTTVSDMNAYRNIPQISAPAPVVVNAGGSGDTKILTTQRATPYDQRFYAGLVQNAAL